MLSEGGTEGQFLGNGRGTTGDLTTLVRRVDKIYIYIYTENSCASQIGRTRAQVHVGGHQCEPPSSLGHWLPNREVWDRHLRVGGSAK